MLTLAATPASGIDRLDAAAILADEARLAWVLGTDAPQPGMSDFDDDDDEFDYDDEEDDEGGDFDEYDDEEEEEAEELDDDDDEL
jgi:hypothetical protein